MGELGGRGSHRPARVSIFPYPPAKFFQHKFLWLSTYGRLCSMSTLVVWRVGMVQILDLKEVAVRLKLSRRTVDRMIKDGKFMPIIQVSPRRVCVDEADLEAWLLSRRRPDGSGRSEK